MQKITPFLWFDTQAEEAAKLSTSLFEGSKISTIRRYGEAGPGPAGQVMTLTFQLAGLTVMALNGGPVFKLTPAISFFVTCGSETQIDALWRKLSDGGTVRMELQKYPFSEKFGWLADRYGLDWQVTLVPGSPTKITPFCLFVGRQAGRAEEAMKFWGSIFGNSAVHEVRRYPDGMGEKPGAVMHERFSLEGQEFMAMDSSRPEHTFTFNEAFSFFVDCRTQEEVDELWEKLSAGGRTSQCGWLSDKYGVSWQIVPSVLGELMGSKDARTVQKVTEAMLKMTKLDIRKLTEAAAT